MRMSALGRELAFEAIVVQVLQATILLTPNITDAKLMVLLGLDVIRIFDNCPVTPNTLF